MSQLADILTDYAEPHRVQVVDTYGEVRVIVDASIGLHGEEPLPRCHLIDPAGQSR